MGSSTSTKSKISLRILGQASAILPCSPAQLTAHFHREISCNALRWLREKQSSHVHASHKLPTGPLKPYKNTKDIQMLVPTTQIKVQSITKKERNEASQTLEAAVVTAPLLHFPANSPITATTDLILTVKLCVSNYCVIVYHEMMWHSAIQILPWLHASKG